jgi:Skp family chaperone for outer membrane proteins
VQAAQASQQGDAAQLRAAQARYIKRVEAEVARTRAELQALAAQRLRLEDSVLAEIKIEVATVAQERRVDTVVTRTINARGAIDLTSDLIARMKRL